MTEYEPELGQAAFGQPWQRRECPGYVEDALETIRGLLVFLHDEDVLDPFSNTGAKFECDVFQVYAYDWNPDTTQEYNFAWRNIRVSWYKHLNRGTSINRHTTWDEAREMLIECMKALLGEEE